MVKLTLTTICFSMTVRGDTYMYKLPITIGLASLRSYSNASYHGNDAVSFSQVPLWSLREPGSVTVLGPVRGWFC